MNAKGQTAPGKLKRYIEREGYLLSHVASEAGIPYQRFSSMLRGKRVMSADELITLCGVLGLRAEDLAGME